MRKRVFLSVIKATELLFKLPTLHIQFLDPTNGKLGETEETKSDKKSQHSTDICDQRLKGESLLLLLQDDGAAGEHDVDQRHVGLRHGEDWVVGQLVNMETLLGPNCNSDIPTEYSM